MNVEIILIVNNYIDVSQNFNDSRPNVLYEDLMNESILR